MKEHFKVLKQHKDVVWMDWLQLLDIVGDDPIYSTELSYRDNNYRFKEVDGYHHIYCTATGETFIFSSNWDVTVESNQVVYMEGRFSVLDYVNKLLELKIIKYGTKQAGQKVQALHSLK